MSVLHRPVPADFIEQRERLRTNTALVKHYGAAHRAVTRWIKELDLKPLPPPPPPPVPDDFIEQRERLRGVNQLAAHYRVSRRRIRRWIAEAGPTAVRSPRRPKTSVFRSLRGGNASVHRINNYGPEDEAADVLRSKFPVYRCDDRGRAAVKGKFWRIGNVVCEGDELIARAEKHQRRAA